MDPREVALNRDRQAGEKIATDAAWLRKQRQARSFTQAQLAAKLGITSNTIARWERCEVPVPHWVRLFLETESRLSAHLAELQKDLDSQKMENAALKNKIGEQARMISLQADLKVTQAQMKEIEQLVRGRRR
jgi:transcriptional regulator with XRE-family HTH domain